MYIAKRKTSLLRVMLALPTYQPVTPKDECLHPCKECHIYRASRAMKVTSHHQRKLRERNPSQNLQKVHAKCNPVKSDHCMYLVERLPVTTHPMAAAHDHDIQNCIDPSNAVRLFCQSNTRDMESAFLLEYSSGLVLNAQNSWQTHQQEMAEVHFLSQTAHCN